MHNFLQGCANDRMTRALQANERAILSLLKWRAIHFKTVVVRRNDQQ